MINLLKNQRGFGMLQAMIFAGVIAAGALVATRVINDLKLAQRGSATKDELEILHRSVETALQDSLNCTATRRGLIDGLSPARVILADSANSTGQLADNPVIMQVGNSYGGNSVKVDSIAISSANPLWAASPDQQVVVTYSRLKSDAVNRLGQGYGGQEVRRVIPITVVYGTAAEERCYADPKTGPNYYSSGSTQKFCQSLGTFMVWDPYSRKCIRNNHVCPADNAFIGVDSNGAVICRRLNSTMSANNLFDTTAPTSCPGRTQLQLVVVGGKIRIQCIAPAGSANLAWTPLTHNFGTIGVSSNSPDQTFTLTNSGTLATSGCSAPTITDTTNFTLTAFGNCVGTNNILAGGSCTVTIRGNPTSVGVKTTTLSRTCTVGGTATTTSNQIIVNGGSGACTGYGYGTGLFTNTTPDSGSCGSSYRYQYFDVDPTKFKVGNIYSITRGRTVTEEVLPSDSITTMLNRLATKINAGGNFASGGCGAGNYNNATVSGSRITHRVYWQNSAGVSGTYSCNIATQAACTATPGCTWDTTSPNVCKGWNFPDPQGTCSGTYNQPSCLFDGSGSGQDMSCQYGYSSPATCSASGMGCYWGTRTQTCYGSNSASCTANAGCSWTAYPSNNRSCTSVTDQTTCQANAACTWGPP